MRHCSGRDGAILCVGVDRELIAIKGGCNLRFFFGSIRYSEDLDLDVSALSKGTLKNKVDRLLGSPAMRLPLKSQGIEVVDVTAPKQTETTQRWKLGLKLAGQSVPVRTRCCRWRRACCAPDAPPPCPSRSPRLVPPQGVVDPIAMTRMLVPWFS